jgi:hypothetical protein
MRGSQRTHALAIAGVDGATRFPLAALTKNKKISGPIWSVPTAIRRKKGRAVEGRSTA